MAQLRPLPIKLTNFLLYSAYGCIVPYQSVYFLHYTEATSSDVGVVMLFAAFFGIVSSLTFCSIGDRYRAHRLVYIVSLCMTCLSFTILFGPIVREVGNKTIDDISATEYPVDLDVVAIEDDETSTPSVLQRSADDLERELMDEQRPASLALVDSSASTDKLWFYIVAVFIGVGTMAFTVNINMCDSFATEIASKCQTSYGAVRLWGSLGLLFSSMLLIFLNKIDCAPFLAPSLCLFTCLSLVNILAVALWPDSRPFDLGSRLDTTGNECDEDDLSNAQPDHLRSAKALDVVIDRTKPNETQARELRFRERFRWLRRESTKRSCSLDLGLQDIVTPKFRNDAVLSKARQSFVFDLAAEDACRNVRRCSLAPLGDSHLLKQFELAASLDNQLPGYKTQAHKLTASEKELANSKHFNFVTVIEPLNTSGASLTEQTRQFNLLMSRGDGKLDKNYQFSSIAEEQPADQWRQQQQQPLAEQSKPMSLKLHLKIIQLIAQKDAKMFRFMLLFAVVGYTSAMQIVYLFPYLHSLSADKFRSLSTLVIMSTFLSETLFYKYSVWFTSRTSNSTSLSVILFVYGLRYSLYLALAAWPHVWPIETVVLIELLQSFSMGLFNCVFTDASFRFAREARDCVPKLIELELIDGSRESIERVNNGVKLTLLSVSSCCYDGIGMALGSLLGGWLIDHLGFRSLWLTSIAIALTFGVWNLVAGRRRARGAS